MATLARKSRGRQKVALKRMEKKSNRLVTFSKRRGGVFKKASELCTLCGVQALCIVFSPAKKTFAFGHPSVEAIINRFLLEDNNLPQDNRVSTKPFQNETLLRSNKEVSLLKDQIDVEKKRGEELLKERKLLSEEAQKFLGPAEIFTLSELKQIQATLIVII
ncbi:agamous-like MADS-box protein AGL62 [Silene latifolia]|uniref:agamous-like MADS-box protein AGL62 n=1 Tax=Silene latifolia TaxID=37657 RepID=UPI003D7860C9